MQIASQLIRTRCRPSLSVVIELLLQAVAEGWDDLRFLLSN
jgi:hypothetical protein